MSMPVGQLGVGGGKRSLVGSSLRGAILVGVTSGTFPLKLRVGDVL